MKRTKMIDVLKNLRKGDDGKAEDIKGECGKMVRPMSWFKLRFDISDHQFLGMLKSGLPYEKRGNYKYINYQEFDEFVRRLWTEQYDCFGNLSIHNI